MLEYLRKSCKMLMKDSEFLWLQTKDKIMLQLRVGEGMLEYLSVSLFKEIKADLSAGNVAIQDSTSLNMLNNSVSSEGILQVYL